MNTGNKPPTKPGQQAKVSPLVNAYEFNDRKIDVNAILYNVNTKWKGQPNRLLFTVNPADINTMMKDSEVSEHSKWNAIQLKAWVAYNSVGGKLDFSVYHLQGIITRQGHNFWSAEEILADKGPLFLMPTRPLTKVYNHLDAGNWLWGYAMHKLGFPLDYTLNAAKKYDPKNPSADQRAIKDGWNAASK